MTTLYFAIENSLVILTMESGQARCDVGLKGHNIACVTVDPVRPQFVYCGTFDSGIWLRDNAGKSWRPAGKGLPHSKIQSVGVSRSERLKGRGIVWIFAALIVVVWFARPPHRLKRVCRAKSRSSAVHRNNASARGVAKSRLVLSSHRSPLAHLRNWVGPPARYPSWRFVSLPDASTKTKVGNP
jgi:hypothetical protein